MNQVTDSSSKDSTSDDNADNDSTNQNTVESDSTTVELNTELTSEKAETNEDGQEEELDLEAQLQLDLANTKDALLRKAAELENVRKRVQKERISLFEDARIQALQDILPIAEDMNRTLEASASTKIDENFLQGVQMVASKFKQLFERYGVEPINQVQVPFDVDFHDAMLRQPTEDSKTPSNTVLQVLESGYKIGNRVIKHAKVIVSE
ncbi:MAG: nucleotide exchange factor GrpE [Balneola sp.]|nr:nucleotide exchange factor GrpE [Balneola sp.]